MSIEDSMIYCLWSAACSAQAARDAESTSVRDAMLLRAAEWADKAWAIYYQKYPKEPEPKTAEVSA